MNNLPQWRTVVNLLKNGSGIVSPKKFHVCVDQNRKLPQYVHFRCGRVHINNLLKQIGISYNLKPSLLKQEMDHDKIYEDTREDKENDWLLYLKNGVGSMAFSCAKYSKRMEELTGFGLKISLILSSLAIRYFKKNNRWKRWTYLYL